MSKRPSGRGASGLDLRLNNLERKLAKLRHSRVQIEVGSQRGTQLGFAFRLATELVAGFVVGGIVGWWLDKLLGTLPLFLLVFFGLGAAAGITNVVRTARRMNEHASEDQDGDDD